MFGCPPWHLPERFLSPDCRRCGATPTRLAAWRLVSVPSSGMAPISSAARTGPAPGAESICSALCRVSGLSLIACQIAASIVLIALRFVAISVAIVLAATAALIRAFRLFSSESEMMRVRRKAVNSLMML